MKNKKATLQYSVAFGTFCTMYCILIGYASVFLHTNGYSNTLIEIIMTNANLLSVII